jgi:serine/threonine protein kinase/tetratricopeptide (TPR) repeat protein
MINCRYKILNKIGEGRSQVFTCSDLFNPENIMVLKVLNSNADISEVQAFHDEYFYLKKFNHPNIISVFDNGEVICIDKEYKDWKVNAGSYFYTMEYFDGHDLSKLPELTDFLLEQIIEKVTSVLYYLHSSNLIHTDLKVENILFRIDDNNIDLKIIDFGFLTFLKERAQINARGSLEYIAPEIIQQEKVDYRIDLYSLGVILYNLIYKKFPYYGENELEYLNAHLKHEVEFNHSNIGKHLIEAVRGLLQKYPEDRTSNILQLRFNLNMKLKSLKESFDVTPKFIGNEKTKNQVNNYLANPTNGNVISIQGENGIGKSRFLEEIDRTVHNSIFISLSGSNNREFFTKKILNDIIFTRPNYDSLDESLKKLTSQLIINEEPIGFSDFKSIVNIISRSRKFVLLIDDIHLSSAIEREILLPLINILQSRGIHIIFTKGIEDFSLTGIKKIREIELEQFNSAEIEELFNFSLFKDLPRPELINWVKNACDGNPSNIFDLLLNLKEIDLIYFEDYSIRAKEFNRNLLSRINELNSEKFQNIFNSLNENCKLVLQSIAIFSENLLIHEISQLLGLSKSIVQNEILALRSSGILLSLSKSFIPKFASQSFKRFISETIEEKADFYNLVRKQLLELNNPLLRSDHAKILKEVGNYKQSLEILSEILDEEIEAQAYNSAIEIVNEILTLRINESTKYFYKFLLAELEFKIGNFNRSMLELEKIPENKLDDNFRNRLEYLTAKCLVKKGYLAGSKNILSRLIKNTEFTKSNPDLFSDFANVELDLGNFKDVLKLANSIINNRNSNDIEIAKMYNFKGLVSLYKDNDLESALESFEVALKYCEQTKDISQTITMHVNIGNIRDMLGDKKNASSHWKKAFKLNQTLGNLEQEAQLLLNLGISDYSEGKHEESIEKYTEALTIFNGIDYKLGTGLCYTNLAEAYIAILEYSFALQNIEKALTIFIELDNREEIIEVYMLQAQLNYYNNSIKNIEKIYSAIINDFDQNKTESLNQAKEFILLLKQSLSDQSKIELKPSKALFIELKKTGQISFAVLVLEIIINYLLKGNFQQQAEELIDEIGSNSFFVKNNTLEAWSYYFQGLTSEYYQEDSASQSGNFYLKSLSKIENESVSRITYLNLLKICEYFLKRGNNTKALNYYNYLESIFNHLEKQIKTDSEKVDFLNDQLTLSYFALKEKLNKKS